MWTTGEDDRIAFKYLTPRSAIPTNVDKVWWTPDTQSAGVFIPTKEDEMDGRLSWRVHRSSLEPAHQMAAYEEL